ncbi:MAG: TetR/AcrR family transcriptional regulator [Planctomycetota bacterium]
MARPIRFKNTIYESAVKLFGEKGLSQTGIRDIAKAAGVSEAALYRHWKGKRELAWDIFRHGLEELHGALSREVPREGPFWHAVLTTVRIFFEAYDRNPQLFGYLLLSQHELWSAKDASVADPVAWWFDLLRSRAGDFQLDVKLYNDVLGPVTLGMMLQPSIAAAYNSVPVPLSQHAETVSVAICRVLGVPWMANQK